MPNNNKSKKVGYSEKNTMPPLGILSIGSYLKIHGYQVSYLDLFAQKMSKNALQNAFICAIGGKILYPFYIHWAKQLKNRKIR